MKILHTLLSFVLIMALCGCGEISEPPLTQQPAQEMQEMKEAEPLEITSFSFTHTGMSTDECFCYSAEQTEEGVRLYIEELFSGGFIVDTIIDEPVLEQLGEMAGRYRLDRWDGFDKKNRHVMDGSRFSLSVELTDGSTISASGSNAFPEGYSDAEQEIRMLFEDLIDRHGNK